MVVFHPGCILFADLCCKHFLNDWPELLKLTCLQKRVVPALQLGVPQLLVQARNMLLQIHERFRLRNNLVLDILRHHLSLVVDLSDLLVKIGCIPEVLLQLRDH